MAKTAAARSVFFREAYKQGAKAAREGRSILGNPYTGVSAAQWAKGFVDVRDHGKQVSEPLNLGHASSRATSGGKRRKGYEGLD